MSWTYASADKLARIARTGFYWFLALAGAWFLAGGKWLATWTLVIGTFIYLGFMGAHLGSTRPQTQKRRTERWEREHPDPALSTWTYAGYLRQMQAIEAALKARYGTRCRDCGTDGEDLDPSRRCIYCADLAALGERDPDLPNPMMPPERR